MATSSKREHAIPGSNAPRAPWPRSHPLLTHTSQGTLRVLSQSLWGLWVLVCTRFVWVLWASLAGMEFDSKDSFVPPTVLLGLLLCPWTWGISSKSLQRCAATTPAPKTGKTDSGRAHRTTVCTPGPRRRDQWPHKRLTQTCLWVTRSLQWRRGLAVACCRVGGTECISACLDLLKVVAVIFIWFSSVAQSCSTLCNPMDCRLTCLSPTPRAYSDSCQLSRWCHPSISSSASPSTPAFNLSQHQGLFKWVSSSYQVAKVLEFQLQH